MIIIKCKACLSFLQEWFILKLQFNVRSSDWKFSASALIRKFGIENNADIKIKIYKDQNDSIELK